MKLRHILPAALLGAALLPGLTACDDDFDYPPVIIPQATMTANTTIAELKEMYWDANSSTTWNTVIGTNAAGDSIIIEGTIISSDKMGNVYKYLMVRNDDGEALTFAVQKGTTDSILSREHKYGQRIVINVTGLSIGKYSGYMEVGEASDSYGITYLDRAVFDAHAQVDGMPQLPVKPVVTTIAELETAKSTASGLMQWQSQLIQLDDVTFEDGGEATFGGSSSYMDRYITDASGRRINVRCSSYSDFAYTTIPTGSGTLVGLLGYYGSSWQILLNGIDRETDLIGFTWGQAEPYENAGDGSAELPYTVADIKHGASGDGKWVTGYIVGCVNGLSIADGAEFEAPFGSDTNILLAADPDCTTASACIPVQLPSGSVRTALGLSSTPGNLGKEVTLYGDIETYFSTTGLKSVTAYVWGAQGTDSGDSGDDSGDDSGTTAENITFVKATSLVSGKKYILADASGNVVIPIDTSKSYGYLYVEAPVSVSGDEIVTSSDNAITFTADGSSWTMLDVYSRYLSMDETHASIQLYSSVESGSLWTVTVASDSEVTIANDARSGYVIRWASNYSNYNVSNDASSGSLPYLYVAKD